MFGFNSALITKFPSSGERTPHSMMTLPFLGKLSSWILLKVNLKVTGIKLTRIYLAGKKKFNCDQPMLSNIGQAHKPFSESGAKKTNSIFANLFLWRPTSLFIDILSSGAGYTIHSNMSARPALLVDAFPISDSRLCTKLAGENSFWVLCLKFTETRQRPAWHGIGLILVEYISTITVLTCSFSWEKIYFGALNEYYICVQ